MTRPSMFTLNQRAEWLLTAWCPQCGAENEGALRPIVMEDGVAKCRCCTHRWTPYFAREAQA